MSSLGGIIDGQRGHHNDKAQTRQHPTADVEALVNTVNCVGVMGRGIALQFRKAFPENFKAYKAVCERGELRPGKLFIYEQVQLTNPRYIINFPTKDDWKGKSRLEYIDTGLEALVQEVQRLVQVPIEEGWNFGHGAADIAALF